MNTHQASKVALAAADAGLQQALADYNLIPTNTTRAVSPSEPAASSRTSRRSQTAGARR
jgi:aspartate/glutamate racemase